MLLSFRITLNLIVPCFSLILCREGRFNLNGLGSLNVKQRAARTAMNPRTGEKVDVPAKRTVTFKISPELKDSLNGVSSKY